MIHPEDHDEVYENEVDFSVSASGPGPLSYQWMKDGEAIIGDGYIGTHLPTLHITSFSQEHKGNYVCIVSSQDCSLTSKPGNLKGIQERFNINFRIVLILFYSLVRTGTSETSLPSSNTMQDTW